MSASNIQTVESSPAKQHHVVIKHPVQLRVLFDAECPLCAREGDLLLRLDKGRGQIELEDISAPDFDPSIYGLTHADVEAKLHAALPDGRVIVGVEVLTRAYAAVGLGWMVAPADWPGIRWILDRAYLWFAKNRLRLTGRQPKYCPVDSPSTPAGS
jgi:predicted DCC family thiol-disulfide oxidoreductase YuxK